MERQYGAPNAPKFIKIIRYVATASSTAFDNRSPSLSTRIDRFSQLQCLAFHSHRPFPSIVRTYISVASIAFEYRAVHSTSMVYVRQSTRLDHRSMGSDHRSMGLDHRSTGSDHRSMGFDHRSMGLDHRSMGLDHRSMGLDHRSMGLDHRSMRLNRLDHRRCDLVYLVPRPMFYELPYMYICPAIRLRTHVRTKHTCLV